MNVLPFPNPLETLVILYLWYFYTMHTKSFCSEIVLYLQVKRYLSKPLFIKYLLTLLSRRSQSGGRNRPAKRGGVSRAHWLLWSWNRSGSKRRAAGARLGERFSEGVSAEQGCAGKVLGKKMGEHEKLSGLELEIVGTKAGQLGWSVLSWASCAMWKHLNFSLSVARNQKVFEGGRANGVWELSEIRSAYFPESPGDRI